MKINAAQALVAVPVLLMGYTFFDSNSHFADKGFDGGTCSVYLLTYSVPLLLAWVPAIGGTWLLVRKKQAVKLSGIFFLVLSLLLFTMLSLFDYDIPELQHPFRIGIILNFLLLLTGIFLAARSSEKQ